MTDPSDTWGLELSRVEAALASEGLRPGDARALRQARAALLLAQAARWNPALIHLRRAAAAAPESAWPWVLHSAVLSQTGDWGAAKNSILSAIRLEPSAELYARLARLYEFLGILPSALSAADEAIARESSADHYALKAGLLLCWREHAEAARCYTSALAQDPDNPALFFSRSQAYSSQGRLDEAIDDARQAALLSPDDWGFWAWSVELLVHSGRRAQARAEINKTLRNPRLGEAIKGVAHFCSGYDRLRSGENRRAVADFRRARQAGTGGALGLKAELYATMAAVLMDLAPVSDDSKVLLAGLGVNPPYSASIEALRALSSCDVVFNNIPGHENFEFLRVLCRECRPLAYHQTNDEDKLSEEILRPARRGAKVGFVTRGCATVYGPLGALILKKCRTEGLRWRDFAAVSSAESLSARFGDRGTASRGLGAFDSAAVGLGERSSREVPLTIYIDKKRGISSYRSLCHRLKREYGGGHEVLVLDHVIGQDPLCAKAAELADFWPRLSPSAILYLPPAKNPRSR